MPKHQQPPLYRLNTGKKILSLVLLWLITACTASHQAVPGYRNVVTARLHQNSALGIMVISDERKGQLWYRTEEEWNVESISNVPETALYTVIELSVSPDDKKLAVITVGEGHPYLDVFDLTAILAPVFSENDLPVAPIRGINPYPGGIKIAGWQDHELIVESDMPLNRLDKYRRDVDELMPMPENKQYYWDVDKDTIRQKGE